MLLCLGINTQESIPTPNTAVELIGFFGMIMGGLLMSLWRGFKSRINTLVFGLFIFGIMAVGMGLTKKPINSTAVRYQYVLP